MVIAEEVEDPVRAEQVELLLHGSPVLDRLRRCHRWAEHDVAEEAWVGLAAILWRTHLVHREGQHVGRSWFAQPVLVQRAHGVDADERDRELGLRVDAHPVEHVPGERDERALVDRCARLVGDLDAHRRARERAGDASRRLPRPAVAGWTWVASHLPYASTM